MPLLTNAARRALYCLPQNGQAPGVPPNLACWNWALTGFGPVQNDPSELFTYVSYGIPLNPGPNAPGLYQNPNFQQSMITLRNQWQPYQNAVADSAQRQTVLRGINTWLVKAAIWLNGIQFTDQWTPYQVVMYYEPQGAHGLNGPNYSHWWLRIDQGGAHNDGLEVFPGATNLTIRRPEYNSGPNTCRVYIPELHQAHVDCIQNFLLPTVIANNHLNLPHFNGLVAAPNCSICNAALDQSTPQYCRCCGRTVCTDCSLVGRIVLLDGRQPLLASGAQQGQADRTCLYC